MTEVIEVVLVSIDFQLDSNEGKSCRAQCEIHFFQRVSRFMRIRINSFRRGMIFTSFCSVQLISSFAEQL